MALGTNARVGAMVSAKKDKDRERRQQQTIAQGKRCGCIENRWVSDVSLSGVLLSAPDASFLLLASLPIRRDGATASLRLCFIIPMLEIL